jgi:prefoldin subunit 5
MFIERDENGNIKGVYANLQEGHVEEILEDDSAEIASFFERINYSIDRKQEAIDALLAEAAARPDAPQEVRDYAAELSK